MDESMSQYEVSYHTTPTPGMAFYKGKTLVYADDEEDAIFRAKRKLQREMLFHPTMIVVTKVIYCGMDGV